jgi:hemoglobin
MLAACFGLLSPTVAAAHDERTQSAAKTLYQRLGGYDALAAVTDDFLGRLAADPKLARFFAGHSKDSLTRIRQLVVDQLCAATGGPCAYTGRDMKTSHAGMGITQSDWKAAAAHLVATLDALGVPAKEKGEVLALVSSLEADIVERPAAAAHGH